MRPSRLKNPVTQWLTRCAFPIAMLGALLAFDPIIMGQHLAGGHSGGFSGSHVGGFSGAHVGGFSGGGFHGGFSTPGTFRGSSGFAPRPFGPAPRMNWTAPRSSFAPQRRAFPGYRPTYGAWNRGENRGESRGESHRGPYRPRYRGTTYGGYPYLYANSWELLPWDLGYSDFTGYGDDNDSSQPNYAQGEPLEEEQQEPPEGPYQPEYPRAPYQPPANQASSSSPLNREPELALIFKDGHTQNIRNYVLTPSNVIVMDDAASGRTPRIPLSDLNLPATEKGAQQAGLEFSPPSA